MNKHIIATVRMITVIIRGSFKRVSSTSVIVGAGASYKGVYTAAGFD
jgi:hypothetical protein